MSVSTAPQPCPRRSTRLARRSALAVALIAVLAAAACSSGSTPSGSSTGAGTGAATGASTAATPTSSGSGAAAGGAVAEATRLLDQAAKSAVTGPSFGAVTADQIVPWTASMMPTPSALPKGKKISVDIVYGLAVGEGPYITALTAALAKKLGWSVKVIRAASQTQPGTLAAFQQALLDKPTAIIAFVVPAVWVGSALAQARKQGIFTVDVHQDTTTGPGYDAYIPNAEGVQKSLMAAYAIKNTNGKASTLLVDAPGFSDANMPAAKTYLATCSGCKTEAAQVNPVDLTDPIKVQSDVTSLLASHPDLDYIMWPNASLPVQPVITAIRSSSNKDAKLLVNGMAPAPIALVKSGAIPLMVQSPDVLLALTALDDVSRLAQGKPPIAQDAIRTPISYWTPSTVPDAQDFAAIAKAQLSNDFLTPFEKAWGVSFQDTVMSVKN